MPKKKAKRECRYLVRFEATATDIRSMSKRLSEFVPADVRTRISKIESGMSRADRLSWAVEQLNDALSEVDSLREELESWQSALPENMQSGSKNDELSDAVSQLETIRDGIDSAVDECGSVSFPSMF